MPYRPPSLSREEQIAQWAAEHPEEARVLYKKAQDGTLTEADLPFTQASMKERKEEYYANNPEQDSRSWWSHVLEGMGYEDPYAEDSSSYSYRKKKWDESVRDGNPDMSWFLPELPETWQMSDPGENDPRPENEKYQAMILNGLSWPLFGFDDEVVAGAGALFGQGTYDDNVRQARRIKEEDVAYEPSFSPRSVVGTTAGLLSGGPIFSGINKGADMLIRGGRRVLGLAPEAASGAGKAAQGAASLGASGAGTIAVMDMGEAEGDVGDRVNAVTEDGSIAPFAAATAVGGGILAPVISKAGGALKRMFAKPAETTGAKVMPRKPPEPWDNPRPPKKPKKPFDLPKGTKPASVRDDIEAAIVEAPKRRK